MDSDVVIQKLKTNLLNVVILIVALFLTHYLYQVGQKNKNLLILQKENEQKKNELLTGISKVVGQIESFKVAVNNKNTSSMLDTFGSIARNNNVVINTLKPFDPIDQGFYYKHSFSLDITADTYHTIGKFISELESSPFFFAIDNLQVGELIFDENESTSIRVQVEVHTILVN